MKFFFLCTFAAAVPAIISGGIAERAKFLPQCVATAPDRRPVLSVLRGHRLERELRPAGDFFKATLGAEFHDFAGSIVVHAVGGWIGFSAVLLLGPAARPLRQRRALIGIPPSSIPWLALGSWLLCIGWFGFNVMSAQSLKTVSGLVAINSLMAMGGGILAALIAGDDDPGFVHNGALAGLVAVCAGSDVMHPIGALVVGGVAGAIFVYMFQLASNNWQIDDVLGVWPLHGLCGLWGGIACGIFGLKALGGMGGVTFCLAAGRQPDGRGVRRRSPASSSTAPSTCCSASASAPEEERRGADLTVHKIGANPEEDVRMGRV